MKLIIDLATPGEIENASKLLQSINPADFAAPELTLGTIQPIVQPTPVSTPSASDSSDLNLNSSDFYFSAISELDPYTTDISPDVPAAPTPTSDSTVPASASADVVNTADPIAVSPVPASAAPTPDVLVQNPVSPAVPISDPVSTSVAPADAAPAIDTGAHPAVQA